MVQGTVGKRQQPHCTNAIRLYQFQCDSGVYEEDELDDDETVPEKFDMNTKCKMVEVDFNDRNYINVTMYERKLSALIDSGADENTVSMGMVDFLFDTDSLPNVHHSPYKHVVLADGRKRIRILGQMFLEFDIAGTKFKTLFHIKDTDVRSVILGNRFLRNNDAVVDFSASLLKLRPISKVRSGRTCVLPPRSELKLAARVETHIPDGQEGLVEPRLNSVSTNPLISLIPSLSRVHRGEMTVCVRNDNEFPVDVRKGEVLGQFELATKELLNDVECHQHHFQIDDARFDTPMGDIVGQQPQSWDEFQNNFIFKNDQTSHEQNEEIRRLLYEFRTCFYEYDGLMGHYTDERVKIDIDDGAKPVRMRPYRVHPKYAEKLDKEIQTLLSQGVVEPSYGDWASPALVVPKPGKPGEIRLVVDFRSVNKLVQKDLHPLPRIEDIFVQVSSTQPKFFSSLDLQSGYFQLDLEPGSRRFTAFCTPQHSLRFTRVPQGLCISGQRFQRVMNRVFQGFINKFIVVYLDDILIYSGSFEEHVCHLRLVLERLGLANLKLKAAKCQFITQSVGFLGHILSSEGIRTDPRLCETVKNCPQPNNVTGIRRFIGLSGFYRKFIHNFSIIARPLHDLTKIERKFEWNEKCEIAFNKLKDALCSAPVLAHPNFNLPFVLYTDSSDFAAGFCLCQANGDGIEHVIAYGGRSYLKYQRNYAVTEKEMLAAYLGVLHFDYYLRLNRFVLVTDHSALISLLSRQKELKGKFARWAAELMCYDFTIKHKAGKKLTNADAISRFEHHEVAGDDPCLPEKGVELTLCAIQSVGVAGSVLPSLDEADLGSKLSPEEVARAQKRDPVLAGIMRVLNGEHEMSDAEAVVQFSADLHKFHCSDQGILFYTDIVNNGSLRTVSHRLVIPRECIESLIEQYHRGEQSAHAGKDKVIDAISKKYFWPRMVQEIVDYIDACVECQRFKLGTAVGKVPVGEQAEPERNELIVMDLCGPLKTTKRGNCYILCIIEYTTRFVRFVPLADSTAKTTALAFYDQWLCLMGAPEFVNSDRGPAFIATVMRELCSFYGIKQKFSCPYVARSHGIIERVQLTLQRALAYYLEKYTDEWDIPLQSVAHAMNATKHCSTGFSPHFLMFGCEISRVIDKTMKIPPHSRRSLREQLQELIMVTEVGRDMARKCSELQRGKYRKTANKGAKDRQFEIADQVFLYIPRNRRGFSKTMSQMWHGPYTIVRKAAPMSYVLRLNETNRVLKLPMHIQRLKLATGRGRWPVPQLGETDDTAEVELITEKELPSDSFSDEQAIGEVDVHSDEQNVTATYEIEKIIQAKHFEDGLKYLCKWKGFSSKHNSYEPAANLNETARKFVEENTIKIVGKPRIS